MSIFSVPLFAFFTVLTVVVLMAGLPAARVALSPLRTVITALIVFFSASPIVPAMAGRQRRARRRPRRPGDQ